jgi:hypothetical protein
MKAKLVGLMAILLAGFGTTAAATTMVAGSGGCPLCK